MMKNGDMPANPIHTVYQDCGIGGNSGPVLTETFCEGLTKRELFAAMAMQGILSNPSKDFMPKDLSDEAARHADALLITLSGHAT